MPHKTRLTLIAASFILTLITINLQAFSLAGAIFGVADEMRRLPAYFDNPDNFSFRNSLHICINRFTLTLNCLVNMFGPYYIMATFT